MKYIKTVFVLVALSLISACSSVGQTQVIQPKQDQIKPGTTIALSIHPPVNSSSDKKDTYTEVIQRLKGQLFGRLMSEANFKQVFHADEKADYKMDVSLLEAKEVSQGERIFLGVLAGSNSLKANVVVYDNNSQSVITSFSVSGKSASHPLSSENDMDDAIKEVIDEIILALQ